MPKYNVYAVLAVFFDSAAQVVGTHRSLKAAVKHAHNFWKQAGLGRELLKQVEVRGLKQSIGGRGSVLLYSLPQDTTFASRDERTYYAKKAGRLRARKPSKVESNPHHLPLPLKQRYYVVAKLANGTVSRKIWFLQVESALAHAQVLWKYKAALSIAEIVAMDSETDGIVYMQPHSNPSRKMKPNPRRVRMGKLVEVRYNRDHGVQKGFYKHTFTTDVDLYADENSIFAAARKKRG